MWEGFGIEFGCKREKWKKILKDQRESDLKEEKKWKDVTCLFLKFQGERELANGLNESIFIKRFEIKN